jgi:tetratricopeptide (TPR) repeat protein
MELRQKKLTPEQEKNFLKKIEHSLKLIKKDELIEALNNLKLTEGELELLANDGNTIEPELLLFLLHNIAYCYQNTGELEEAASYIEACIYNSEKKFRLSKNKTKSDAYYSSRIKQCSYLSTLYSYLCVLMSCVENHYIAVLHAKQAVEYATQAIRTTIKAVSKGPGHSISAQKLRKKIYLGEVAKKPIKEKTHTNIPILNTCLRMVTSKDQPTGLIKLNTIEGLKSELKETMNIDSAMKIKPITYYKIKTLTNLDFELDNDEAFKKIFNSIISLYLLSVEQAMMDSKELSIFSRNKAVAISRTFLPNDCLLISQIQYLDE